MVNRVAERQNAMARMLTAPMASPAPKPAAGPVTACTHVLPGAVWCNNCATANLAYARKMYEKATTQSNNPAVHNAAKTLLTKALLEQSITDAGVEALECAYLRAVESVQTTQIMTLWRQLLSAKDTRAQRNQNARSAFLQRAASAKSAAMFETMHALPNMDSNGRVTTASTKTLLTAHASERMTLRNIPLDLLTREFQNPVQIDRPYPHNWRIVGQTITLIGFFIIDDEKTFVVKTAYRNDASHGEKAQEEQTATS